MLSSYHPKIKRLGENVVKLTDEDLQEINNKESLWKKGTKKPIGGSHKEENGEEKKEDSIDKKRNLFKVPGHFQVSCEIRIRSLNYYYICPKYNLFLYI